MSICLCYYSYPFFAEKPIICLRRMQLPFYTWLVWRLKLWRYYSVLSFLHVFLYAFFFLLIDCLQSVLSCNRLIMKARQKSSWNWWSKQICWSLLVVMGHYRRYKSIFIKWFLTTWAYLNVFMHCISQVITGLLRRADEVVTNNKYVLRL